MSDDGMSNDDQLETRLRRALNSEAAMVQPAGDGLQKIREDIDERRHRSWWRNPAIALVAAAVVGLTASGLYFSLSNKDNTSAVPPATTDSPTATTSDTPSPSPSQSPTESATGEGGPVYVYYIHDDGQAPRLYRESHPGVGSGDAPEQALRAMFAGQADDPDYATPWDNTSLVSYAVEADTAKVVLNRFVDRGKALNRIALQELVYTVTANDPAVKKVNLSFESNDLQGAFNNPLRRAPMVDTQGLIWILAPTQGSTVSSPVKIDGYGTANEGTISWEVRKDGVVVEQGHTQGGSMGEFGEFHDTVTLPPGDYELSAFESSAKDGSPIHIDTKNFTVE
jgi:hypothetical protein